MATEGPPEETKVSDRGMVTIPADIRRNLDIGPGDKLRWNINEDGDWYQSYSGRKPDR